MSELITLTSGASETIHGTYAGSIAYVAMVSGAAADAWTALTADARKRTLGTAVRYLNAQTWIATANTFALRDAIVAFTTAQYELAILIAADPGVTSNVDSGSNISSVNAGGAGVTFFNPTSARAGTATRLPPLVQRLVGAYLAASAAISSIVGGFGQTGSDTGPMHDCVDYDRTEPL